MKPNFSIHLSPEQKEIYKNQDAILLALKKKKPPYVLSGGTALSRFYFHHRFSEDLDFFCETTEFSFEVVEGIIHALRKAGMICELVGRTDQPGRLKVASYVVRCPLVIKVDFIEDPFTGMWEPLNRKTESGVTFRVDALDQIYYRKLFSLLEQWHRSRQLVRGKDLVDLYCLHHYHKPLDRTLVFFRRNHVPMDEEKIIMILGNLKQKEVNAALQDLICPWSTENIWKTLKKSAEKIFQEGMKR